MSTICLNPSDDDRQPRRQSQKRPIFNAYAVANWFLHITIETDNPITLVRLHKLVCLAYGWYLARCDKLLFDDKIVMSHSGPVVLSLEEMFERFGTKPITRFAQFFQDDKIETIDFSIHPEKHEWFNNLPLREKQRLRHDEQEVEHCLQTVWNMFGGLPYENLMTAVCCPDSEMLDIYDNLGEFADYEEIPTETLNNYFKDFFAATEHE
jgi:uncharacterized phage-associated protein